MAGHQVARSVYIQEHCYTEEKGIFKTMCFQNEEIKKGLFHICTVLGE